MIVAIVGSRSIKDVNLQDFLPPDTSEIVSGGAIGVDTVAKRYANKNNIKITEFLPNYPKYGNSAPLKRNLLIIDYADLVLAFWDGKSRGTIHVYRNCQKQGVPVKLFRLKQWYNHNSTLI